MSVASFTGISSGIDWRSMVDQIMLLERRPLTAVERRISVAEKQKTAWAEFDGLVSSFRTLNTDLRWERVFNKRVATVGDSSAGFKPFSVTLADGAETGTHNVRVESLAVTEKWASKTYTSSSDGLGLSGSFFLNGTEITVGTSDSLSAIRDTINNANAGVTASVVQTATSEYRLSISSTTAGAAGITYADGTNGVGTSMSLAETVAGADAVAFVNGIEVRRTSNELRDVLPGVTINLLRAAPGEDISLNIAQDSDKIAETVKSWVDAYNKMEKFIDDQFTAADGKSNPPLYNNPSLRLAKRMLQEVLSTSVDSASGATYQHLYEIGIQQTKTGDLNFDETKFKEALSSDSEGVRRLFGRSVSTSASTLSVVSAPTTVTPGRYDVNITTVASRASVAGTGFTGTYAGVSSTFSVTDQDGTQADVILNTGMTTANIVTALNNEFQAKGMGIQARAANDGTNIVIEHNSYGSAYSFTYTADAQLGFLGGTETGVDVQGSFTDENGNTIAATGSGRDLAGDSGTIAEGLKLRYTGTSTGTVGYAIVDFGFAYRFDDKTALISTNVDSIYNNTKNNLEEKIGHLEDQKERIQARLDTRRKRLEAEFLKMEALMGQFTSQGTWLDGQIMGLNATLGG